MKPSDLLQIVRAAFFTPNRSGWGLPLLIDGEPGIGKTARIEQFATSIGAEPVTVLASIREPEDFIGLPVPSADGSLARLPDRWVREANEAAENGDGALVFLDEINHANDRVFAALLRVVNERHVGDTALHPRVRIVAAMNAVGEGGGQSLPSPLANRFGHLRWSRDDCSEFTAWLAHGESLVFDQERAGEVETRVLARWDAAFADARAKVAAFLNANPKHYYVRPSINDDAASKAWPSQRTWELAARAYASSRVHALNDDLTEEFIAAFVGKSASAAFALWAARSDLPSVDGLLDGSVAWEPSPSRPDVTDAVLGGVVAVAIASKRAVSDEAAAVRVLQLLYRAVELGHADSVHTHAKTFVSTKGVLASARVSTAAVPLLGALHSVQEAARRAMANAPRGR